MKHLSLMIFVAVAGVGLVARGQDEALPRLPQDDRSLAERFANPPASTRILPIIHGQHDDPVRQDQQRRQLAARGFGGFVGNVSFKGYVDDETKWPAFLRGVREARAAGMSLWLYDECGYPSGSARDLTLRGHPEWAARGLLVAEAETAGGPVELVLPPGRLVSAVALPVRAGVALLDEAADLAAAVTGGTLRWQAPAGDWRVLAMTEDLIYSNTHAAVSVAFKNPCINLLMPEPTKRFLEVTHDRYAAKLDQNLGRWFVSTFTDEPSLQNYWFRPAPYRVLPWSDSLAREFKRRRGDQLVPLLPALVVEAGPRGAKVRYDFWLTVAELVSENYFGQIQDWCHRHRVRSGGHLLMEESLAAHVPLYGDFVRCARRLDAPSIDCLTSIPADVPWQVARLIGSVADLEERDVTMCETSDFQQRYRPEGDKRPVRIVTEDEIRGTCNRLLWAGINTITSYYAFQGLDDAQLRRLNEWVGRCATMLRGGRQVADIAVLHPTESLWPVFVPARQGATDAAGARRIERVYDAAAATLYAANRDFTFVDARAVAEAKVRRDALSHGDLRWRVLVLPAVSTLPADAWKNIERFWRNGGVVFALGDRPANSESAFPSQRMQEAAREMFGAGDDPRVVRNDAGGVGVCLPAGMIALLPQMLDAMLERDAAAGADAGPVRITHRRLDGHDVYFAINDGASPWRGSIRFPAPGVDERWDPDAGTMTRLNGGTNELVELGPYDGLLFRARAIEAPRRRSDDAPLVPSFASESLPVDAPAMGKGEFVRATLSGDPVSGWTADAAITQSGVDTHLFLSFDAAAPFALSGSDGLLVETIVPPVRQTGVELLVILHANGGNDYIAGSGRMLSTPGPARSYLLFSQFRRAGWSKGADEPLDTSKVTSIRVGWGGHLGVEGETIGFTTRAPQRFRCGVQPP